MSTPTLTEGHKANTVAHRQVFIMSHKIQPKSFLALSVTLGTVVSVLGVPCATAAVAACIFFLILATDWDSGPGRQAVTNGHNGDK